MNDYPSVDNTDEFTQEQKAAFLGSAMCIATGSKTAGGSKVTANIPLSDITPAVPTKLSDLTDDITVDDYDATSEAPISGKGVASALANFGGFIVTTKGQDGKPAVSGTIDPKAIYLTPTGETGTENAYDEWICTDTTVPTWEKVGVTRVDLSQYYTKSDADDEFVKQNRMGTAIAYDSSSGGICIKYDDERALDVDHDKLGVSFDDSTIVMGGDGLEVAVPVPDNTTGEGEILCWQSGSDLQGIEPHAVWCSPGNNDIVVDTTNGDIRLAVPVPDPKGSPAANDGDVLTYDAQSDEIVWAAPQGGGGGGAAVIRLNVTRSQSGYVNLEATYNGAVITPADVIALFKTNANLIMRTYRVYNGVEYDEANYYPHDYFNGEQQMLNFFGFDFGSGGSSYTTTVITADACNEPGTWVVHTI